MSIQTAIKELLKELQLTPQFTEHWDKQLPEYCFLKLQNDEYLTVSKCLAKYIATVINYKTNDTRSFVFEIEDDKPLQILNAPQSVSTAQLKSQQLQTTEPEPEPEPANGELSSGNRNPNAPPDFENEFQNSRNHEQPTFQFDPESDLYPMGLKHPTLDPMGHMRIKPGSGMVPNPFGSSKPPHINYDPTSPFDSSLGKPPFM